MTPETNVLDALGTEFSTFPPAFFKSFDEDYSSDEEMCKSTDGHMWKGFSLPPTPPITPACSPLYSPVSDFTDREQPFCAQGLDDEPDFCEETSIYSQDGELKDILIKDCMWSGSSFDKSNSERQRVPTQLDRERLLCQTPPLGDLSARILSVDPSEIFPFPLNGDTEDKDRTHEGIENSDSEEEVDVVTIEKATKRESETQATNESNDDIPPTVEQNSFPKTSPDASTFEESGDDKTSFTGKVRTKRRRKSYTEELGLHLRQHNKESKNIIINSSSGGESDESENDSDFTRASHNVLERKRRNDLKLKFQRLRDSVPELKDNERAPKVSILRKSWEHILRVKDQEKKLLSELEKQKRLNANLLKRLLDLNETNN